MNLNAAAGLSGMLKSGHKHLSGPDATVVRNVEAARDLSRIVSTSLGPNGMNKLVVNHLERIIVTSDCAAIVRELEIEHPAAKMLSMASDAQDKECGDGTNLTVSFAGELLGQTEDLLRMGLHPSEIVEGYKKAGERLLELLPALAVETVDDPRDRDSLLSVVSPVLSAKQYGSEDVLAPLVVDACLGTMGSSSSSGRPSVNPDSVRVSKILGSNVAESRVIRGFVALRGSESTVTSAADAKITIFGCGIEASGTEAKGTVLMKNADDLKGYNKSEEKRMEERLRMKNDVLFDCSTKNGVEDDLQQLLTDHCNIVEDEEEQDALWELKTSPAWEEEDDEEEFDPTKERRLSGTDPVSLWGDILSP